MILLAYDRLFQFWDMHPTFGRVLLRSLRGDGNKDNVDVIFHGVFYLETMLSLDGLRVEYAKPNDVEYLESRTKVRHNEERGSLKYFSLDTNSGRLFIGAFDFRVEVNDLEPLETSLDR